MRDAVLAWASVTACAEPLSETLPAAIAWTRALWSLGEDRAPLFVVHDLGWILLRGNDFRASSVQRGAPEARAEEFAWRDRALGRWCLDPSAREAHVVLSASSASERDAAVAHALSLCLSRLLAPLERLPRGNPAHLRALSESLREGLDAPAEGWLAWAREQRREVIEVIGADRLFSPAELWEIAHFRELPGEGARLALRALHGLVAAIAPMAPSTRRALHRELRVEGADAGAYPAGGFEAISTRGGLENLVRSEVALVGEGVDALGGADLFDLRFATGELLFYARDESPLYAPRREVTVIFDRPADLRVKQPEHPAQALLMLDAAALTLHEELLRAQGAHGLCTTLRWNAPRAEDIAVADEERALLSSALGREIAHRRVVLDGDVASSKGVRVVLSARDPTDELPHDAWLLARGERWSLRGLELDPRALRDVVTALLDAALAGA